MSKRPATRSSGPSRKTEQRPERGTATLQKDNQADLSISWEVTSFSHLARTEPVLYFPYLHILLPAGPASSQPQSP